MYGAFVIEPDAARVRAGDTITGTLIAKKTIEHNTIEVILQQGSREVARYTESVERLEAGSSLRFALTAPIDLIPSVGDGRAANGYSLLARRTRAISQIGCEVNITIDVPTDGQLLSDAERGRLTRAWHARLDEHGRRAATKPLDAIVVSTAADPVALGSNLVVSATNGQSAPASLGLRSIRWDRAEGSESSYVRQTVVSEQRFELVRGVNSLTFPVRATALPTFEAGRHNAVHWQLRTTLDAHDRRPAMSRSQPIIVIVPAAAEVCTVSPPS